MKMHICSGIRSFLIPGSPGAAVMAALALAIATPVSLLAAETHIVLYRELAVPANAETSIAKAGGTLINRFDRIGVAVATSDQASFRQNLLKDQRVEAASSTARFGARLNSGRGTVRAAQKPALPPAGPVPPQDNLSQWQWDMRQIHAPEAQAITMGDRSVIVGDIDTGLDFTHPDLAANVDYANSVSCLGGVPNQDPAAWMDFYGHGTHTAGTIAAAANGIGIIGVAPNVKVAAIKAGNDEGYFFPEAVICAFMWAADRKLDALNNSYFADPWLFNCRNDPEQRAIWKAEQRAIRYAISQGVTVVAAIGNENIDLAHPTVDSISPDWPPDSAVEREVNNACVVIPVEIPGVIGVSANGSLGQKAFYSTYGAGVVQVVAPGGDGFFQISDPVTYGWVLSTIPKSIFDPTFGDIQDPTNTNACYGSWGGTSMATPHVTGVAALIISRYGKMPPGRVQAIITGTADPVGCPSNPFDPDGTGDWQAICQGGVGQNSFYGHGQVNALNAVSSARSR
jgi:subtilisin family serine protease